MPTALGRCQAAILWENLLLWFESSGSSEGPFHSSGNEDPGAMEESGSLVARSASFRQRIGWEPTYVASYGISHHGYHWLPPTEGISAGVSAVFRRKTDPWMFWPHRNQMQNTLSPISKGIKSWQSGWPSSAFGTNECGWKTSYPLLLLLLW